MPYNFVKSHTRTIIAYEPDEELVCVEHNRQYCIDRIQWKKHKYYVTLFWFYVYAPAWTLYKLYQQIFSSLARKKIKKKKIKSATRGFRIVIAAARVPPRLHRARHSILMNHKIRFQQLLVLRIRAIVDVCKQRFLVLYYIYMYIYFVFIGQIKGKKITLVFTSTFVVWIWCRYVEGQDSISAYVCVLM